MPPEASSPQARSTSQPERRVWCRDCAGTGQRHAWYDGFRLQPCDACRGLGEHVVRHLTTVQTSDSGLLDGDRGHEIHIVGYCGDPLLCGTRHHGPNGLGFSVGGGHSGPPALVRKVVCCGCVEAWRSEYDGLPLEGLRQDRDLLIAASASSDAGLTAVRADRLCGACQDTVGLVEWPDGRAIYVCPNGCGCIARDHGGAS